MAALGPARHTHRGSGKSQSDTDAPTPVGAKPGRACTAAAQAHSPVPALGLQCGSARLCQSPRREGKGGAEAGGGPAPTPLSAVLIVPAPDRWTRPLTAFPGWPMDGVDLTSFFVLLSTGGFFSMNSSTSSTDNENFKKKLKGDKTKCSPSRVLHLRSIPKDVTEAEIISLGLLFGKVTNILILRDRSQALLEMASEEAATTMLNYYVSATPYVHNQPGFVQFSNHTELKTDNLPNQARPQAALGAVNSMQPGNMAAANDGTSGVPQNSVLRIIVENTVYPVTLDVLYQLFSRYGSVLKIITFTKSQLFQALLQYADPTSAYYAKVSLDGHCIYTACCTIRIHFSRLTDLKVKYNNNKSRDFTRFDLPSGEGQPPPEQSMAAPYGNQTTYSQSYVGASGYAPAYGYVPTYGYAQGFPVQSFSGVHSYPAVTTSGAAGCVTTPTVTSVPESPVILVNNLNPEAITPHGLFILFGLYGDVHRVKILYNKKESALVEMADIKQAQTAMRYLDGQRIYGRILHTTFSKYHRVVLPRKGQDGQDLTKDYTNSPLHRFKKRGSRNFRNIFPPSATLRLSNIPSSVTVDELKKLFVNTGSTMKNFRFFQKDCKMALVQLSSVEEAIHALIELHGHDFGENNHLHVSFSNTII
ncbi:polypyrimidine tract-binding protein 3 [Porphyrio hochstetteri]